MKGLSKVWPGIVEIMDVGPRDGLQNLTDFVPTEVKLELIKYLAKAGVKKMEVTSFVHPKAIPQMVDAAKVAAYAVEKCRRVGLDPHSLGAQPQRSSRGLCRWTETG